MPNAPETDAASLIAALRRIFEPVDAPASIKQLAEIYGVLAAQQDAMDRLQAMVLRGYMGENVVEEAEATSAALRVSSRAFSDALKRLANDLDAYGDEQ